jgi:hypothetical protein
MDTLDKRRGANIMETYHLTSAQDNAIGEYRQVDYMRVENEAARLNQIWLLAFVVAMTAVAFVFLARNLGKLPATFKLGPVEIAIGVIVLVTTLVVQAWMYVLVLRHYGAKPTVGIFHNNVIAYISAPGYGLRRNAIIVTALLPLTLLLGFAFIGIWLTQGTASVALFAFMAVVSAGASTSHLWEIVYLLRFPSSAWAVDDEHGMRILLPMDGT